MAKKRDLPENQDFINLVGQLKKIGVSYSSIDRKAGFRNLYTNDVILGRSSAGKEELIKLKNAYPEIDPDFQEETITEKIKRIEEENEKLFNDIQLLKAKLFDLENNCNK